MPRKSRALFACAMLFGFGAIVLRADESTALSGTVTSKKGEALGGAVVRAVRVTGKLPPLDPNYSDYAAESGDDGSFVLHGVAPGQYILSADHSGYVRGWYGGDSIPTAKPVSVAAGAKLGHIDIPLFAEGSITGQVRTRLGERLKTSIMAIRKEYSAGTEYSYPAQIGMTSEDGQFSLRGLRPGRYYMLAEPFRSGAEAGGGFKPSKARIAALSALSAEQRGDDKPVPAEPVSELQPTYYPGSLTLDTAMAIDVPPGAEVSGVEIRVLRSPVFSVCGGVKWDGLTPFPLTLTLTPLGFQVRSVLNAKLTPVIKLADGRPGFCYDSVPPGEYVVEPQRALAQSKTAAGARTVFVSDHNLLHQDLVLSPAVRLEGIVVMAAANANSAQSAPSSASAPPSLPVHPGPKSGPNPAVPPPPGYQPEALGKDTQSEQQPGNTTAATSPEITSTTSTSQMENPLSGVHIRLAQVDRGWVNLPQADVQSLSGNQSEASFALRNVPAGLFRVVVESLPADTYVQSIRWGGELCRNGILNTTTTSSGSVEITVRRGAQTLAGLVMDADDKLSPGAVVSLAAEANLSAPYPLIRQTIADENGRFSFPGLAPDAYLVVGWQGLEPPGLGTLANVFQTFQPSATRIDASASNLPSDARIRVVTHDELARRIVLP